MAANARLAYTNLARAAGAVVTASSEQAAFTRARLLDEDPGLRWRSKLGWNVRSDNSRIDFNRGGVKQATIAAGNYPTPALYAAAVVAALEAADATPVWACSYNAGTGKFTISSDLAFTLLFASGAAIAAGTSAHLDLGYTGTDKGSAASQVAEGAALKSREWLVVDLGAAAACTLGIVFAHNLGAGGTVTLQAAASNTAGAWAAPAYSVTLAGDAAIRLAYFAAQTYRYWRVLVDDVAANAAAYTELGVVYVGTYAEPAVNYSVNFSRTPVQLSTVTRGISGAVKRDQRPAYWAYQMSWLEVAEADRAKLAAWVAACPAGAPFFLGFDPTNTPTDVVYGMFVDGTPQEQSSNLYWTVPLTVEEVLS